MGEKPLVQSLGTALLLVTLIAAESLRAEGGGPHMLTLRFAELGFALFAARALLTTRPLGAWVRARPAPLRYGALALFAAVLMLHSFWASVLAMGTLLFFGGILAVEFLDDAARVVARPPASAARRPLRFALLVLATTALVALFHDILARGIYLARGDTPVALAFGMATFGLFGALLLLGALVAFAAWTGRGRDALPRRALHLVAFVYVFAWFLGYNSADALGALESARFPLLAVGVAAVQFAETLFETSDRASSRALPREGLWDLFLTVAFASVFLLGTFDMGGMAVGETLFDVKAVAWVGFAAGAAIVPLARRKAQRAAPAATIVPADAPA